jgi:hypothetical protein
VVSDFYVGEDLVDLRPLSEAAGYEGNDPVADGFLAITSDGAGGLIVSVDPTHRGVMHAVVDLQHVSSPSFHVGIDLIW